MIVERLIMSGVNVDATDEDEQTALHFAAIHGNPWAQSEIIFENTEFNSYLGSEKVVELLLRSGSNVNATDNSDATALHKAAENGTLKISTNDKLFKVTIFSLRPCKYRWNFD